MAKLTLAEWLERLENNRRFMENVRAIRKIPARPGSFADYPAWVDPHLQAVLKERGMERLYSHQAKALECAPDGPGRHPGHADGQRQDPLLQSSRYPAYPGRAGDACPLSLSHEGPGPGPDARGPRTDRGTEGGHQDLHLRRRHAPTTPARPSASRATSS